MTDILKESFVDPRAATRRIIAMDLPVPVLWQALAAVVALSVLLDQGLFWLSFSGVSLPNPDSLSPMDARVLELTRIYAENPLLVAALQGALAVIAVLATTLIGQAMGGTGRFEDALAMIAWFQALLFLLQVAQMVVGLILPPLTGLAGMAALILFFYLITMFVTELHGFRNPASVFAMIIVTLIGIAMTLAVLMSLLGVGMVPEMSNA